MSNLSDYISSLKLKLEGSSYLNGNGQVSIYEDYDMMAANETSDGLVYPRMSIVFGKVKGNGYDSQRGMQVSFRYAITGSMKFPGAEGAVWKPTLEHFTAISDFGVNTMARVYKMLDDKQTGLSPCKGFIMMGEFPELFLEPELIPKIMTFTFTAEAIIEQEDTEE